MADLHLIGSRMRKVDGLEKSTGRALFTDDITLPGMLHGKILRSPHPHARILSIDTSRAEAVAREFDRAWKVADTTLTIDDF